jgi:DNA-directed RNA polymerase subunit delta
MYSGDKVFYCLKLTKNKIFKLLLNYIYTNELQNSVYNHELFKKTYIIYKNGDSDDDKIDKIYINNINFDEYDNNDVVKNNDIEDNDENNDENYDNSDNSDDDYDDENDYVIDSDEDFDNEDIDDNYNEENKILLSIYELIKDEGNDDDLKNMILLLLKILSFNYLTLLSPSCCNDDGTTFFGIELGSNHITHRYIIDKYKNFHNYYDNYMNNVIIMKNKMKRNKELYDNEFNKLIDTKPMIYCMANDCYRCT